MYQQVKTYEFLDYLSMYIPCLTHSRLMIIMADGMADWLAEWIMKRNRFSLFWGGQKFATRQFSIVTKQTDKLVCLSTGIVTLPFKEDSSVKSSRNSLITNAGKKRVRGTSRVRVSGRLCSPRTYRWCYRTELSLNETVCWCLKPQERFGIIGRRRYVWAHERGCKAKVPESNL